MVNYNNGKIYMIEPIVEHEEGDVYIGSTTKKYLSQRMEEHRKDYKQSLTNEKRRYTSSIKLFDKYGLQNCKIILLESFECNSKDELTAREAYYIKKNKCINIVIPTRTYKEYYNDNKEKIHENQRKYRSEHKEIMNNYSNQYYNNNKETLLKHASEVLICECGGKYTKSHKNRHCKSNKHQKFVNTINL